MTDNINKLSQNINGNKQQTSASIANLSDEDVVKIWDAVSTYVESYMKQSKGVAIPGFGTFSFIHKRVDVGNNKYLLIQRPVFVLSEKIAQTHGLKTTRYPVNGSIPVHPLNFFFIQTQSIYTRDQIDLCVKHVLQVFNRSIAAQRNVEFTFTHIGKLQIHNGKVKMRFFKDFVSSVDENGKLIIDNMCNRPQTCDSVMSAREATRPPTASNVVLPRLNSRVGNLTMQVIQEENQNSDEEQENNHRHDELQQDSTISRHIIKTVGRENTHEGIIPIASLFSSMDIIRPSTAASMKKKPPPSALTSLRRSISMHQPEPENEQVQINRRPSTVMSRSTNENIPLSAFNRPPTDRILSSQSVCVDSPQITTCGHFGIGQDMCQLCHRRAKLNIPVYLHEEKRIREAEEDKLLNHYRDTKDMEEQRKQDAALKAAREERQKVAAFNLGIAEATRAKKLDRTQELEIPRSIIFRKRLRTPPTYIKQHDFARQIEAQIKTRQEERYAEKSDKDFSERLEQIQLAETLAQERESYLKNKRHQQGQLKNALFNQIQSKPIEPMDQPDKTLFGLNDMSTEELQQRRLHAIDIVRQEKELIEQRQRQQLLKQIHEQEYELKALDIMKDDLISERRERHRRDLKIRKNLESDWINAMDGKHKRDEDERMHLKAPQGILVHEQCDQYRRCAQCQRNLDNYGKTNVWSDTRYIPGARIMV
ncbi:unnamed protein product [Adineta steineri]|uniref:Coiled-coil domain-containing protein 81 n=1 Tax=Adineta steineri TaxID=433720 RepID=A0A815IRR3_9BILA|nr:unnamed protein product [Adineta steineri]